MANKFLDGSGLSYLWSKIKAKFAAKEDVPTKLSELTDDTASDKRIQYAEYANIANEAAYALNDGSGNIIADTYATKADVETINETITKMEVDDNGTVMSAQTANSAIRDENGKTIIAHYATKDELGNYAPISNVYTKAEVESRVGSAVDYVDAKMGTVYTKTEVDGKLSAVYKFKGSVDTYSALPTENLTVGDVYNVKAASKANGVKAGDNVAWDGTAWDVLSGTVDLSGYMLTSDMEAITNAEIDTIIAS